MNCKTIERLILESEDRPLGIDERRIVDDHLEACAACRAFEAGRRTIREALNDTRWAELPPSLGSRTRRLCLEGLAGAKEEAAGSRAGRARMPVPVAVAALLFTILAVGWIAGVLADLKPGESLPASAWLAVVFITQNVITLFLAPVILGAGRPAGDEETRSVQRI